MVRFVVSLVVVTEPKVALLGGLVVRILGGLAVFVIWGWLIDDNAFSLS